MKQDIIQTVKVLFLAIIFSLGVSSVYAAWSEPTGNPTTCPSGSPGCDAPLNVSSNNQYKVGKLRLGGNVVPGTGSPVLEVTGNITGINGFLTGLLEVDGKITSASTVSGDSAVTVTTKDYVDSTRVTCNWTNVRTIGETLEATCTGGVITQLIDTTI